MYRMNKLKGTYPIIYLHQHEKYLSDRYVRKAFRYCAIFCRRLGRRIFISSGGFSSRKNNRIIFNNFFSKQRPIYECYIIYSYSRLTNSPAGLPPLTVRSVPVNHNPKYRLLNHQFNSNLRS